MTRNNETAEKNKEKMIISSITFEVLHDPDISNYYEDVTEAMRDLLSGCEIHEGRDETPLYTSTLVKNWIIFAQDKKDRKYNIPLGSAGEDCGDAAVRGIKRAGLYLKNANQTIQQKLVSRIKQPTTLNPDRDLEELRKAKIIS